MSRKKRKPIRDCSGDIMRVMYIDPDNGMRVSRFWPYERWGELQKKIGELQLRGVDVKAKRLTPEQQRELTE